DLAAGFVFEGKLGAGQALRIMTGAPMPAGAGTVYPQEVVQREGDSIRVGPIDKGANVRLAGEDVRMGEVVIEAGSVLRPQEIGLMASLGAWQVSVRRRPRVALLSTGDEVAEPGTPRRPGQIYDANRFTLRGSIEQCGGEVIDLGIVPDVRDTLRPKLAGRRRLFPETWQARALEPMRKKTGRTEYKRGILAFRDGDWEVCTTGPQGSGILSSMVAGNCFVVLEEARGDVKVGERVTVE